MGRSWVMWLLRREKRGGYMGVSGCGRNSVIWCVEVSVESSLHGLEVESMNSTWALITCHTGQLCCYLDFLILKWKLFLQETLAFPPYPLLHQCCSSIWFSWCTEFLVHARHWMWGMTLIQPLRCSLKKQCGQIPPECFCLLPGLYSWVSRLLVWFSALSYLSRLIDR